MPTPELDPWGHAIPYDPNADVIEYFSTSPTPATSVNALSFPGVDRTGVTSSSLGLQAAIDYAASLTPKGAVFIPRGKYLMSRRFPVTGVTGIAVGIVIPSGVSVYGEGHGTEIHDATPFSYANTEYATAPDGYSYHRIFMLSGGNNELWGLRFTGLNGDTDGVGYVTGENFQNACIGTTVTTGPTNGHSDINIHDCLFHNFYGFSFQDLTAYNDRVNFDWNKCRYTANGLNTNGNYSSHCNNEFWAAEGIEAAGDFLSINGNRLAGPYMLGINLYGNYLTVSDNNIDGTELTGADGSPGVGAVLSMSGCQFCVANNNTITNLPSAGISIASDVFGYTHWGPRQAANVSLNGNVITNVRSAGQNHCLMLSIRIADNISVNGGSVASNGTGALYAGDIGIYVNETTNVSINNVAVTGTRFGGISVEGTNTGITLSNNKCSANLGFGISVSGCLGAQLIGNSSTGSLSDIVVSSTCTLVRLVANQAGYAVIDPTGVKYEEGNSWQD